MKRTLVLAVACLLAACGEDQTADGGGDDVPLCGDAVVEGVEGCDDGNRDDGDGCSSDCRIETPAACGDGVVDVPSGERCDDGVLNSDTTPDACRNVCPPPRGGEGVVAGGVVFVGGGGCTEECREPSTETCGDGIIQPPEECDDGNEVPDDGCDGCALEGRCGDGVLDPGEDCDDGDLAPGDGCDGQCRIEGRCGDGVVAGGEECDDGNFAPGDGCSASCRTEICGNGVLDPGEACDDGNLEPRDGCDATCRFETFCGDGRVDPGEACDFGPRNSDTEPDTCRTDCTLPRCGDGVVDTADGCDDGNVAPGDGCDERCQPERPAVCGDGFVDPGEACDDGAANSDVTPDACRTDCTFPSCGDGVVDAGEGCDEGAANSQAPDATCRPNCAAPGCGDGILDPGEGCDDGNASSGDECLVTCVAARCGDGQIRAGIEECDDGPANSNTAPDACRTDCLGAECGDGVVDTGEVCDDFNDVAGDGCSPTCGWEATFSCGAERVVDLSTATPDGRGGFRHAGSTLAADNGGRSAACNAGASSGDVVHGFVAPGGHDLVFTTVDPGTNYDSAVFVRTTCGNAATEVGCDGSLGGALGATVEVLDAPAGTAYYVWVDGLQGAEGDYVLHARVRRIAAAGEPCDGVQARCGGGLTCVAGSCG